MRNELIVRAMTLPALPAVTPDLERPVLGRLKSTGNPQGEAWSIFTANLASGRTVLPPEPDEFDTVGQRVTTRAGSHIRDWTDTNLASFAIHANCRMVSFDADFEKYQNADSALHFLHLKPRFKDAVKI